MALLTPVQVCEVDGNTIYFHGLFYHNRSREYHPVTTVHPLIGGGTMYRADTVCIFLELEAVAVITSGQSLSWLASPILEVF